MTTTMGPPPPRNSTTTTTTPQPQPKTSEEPSTSAPATSELRHSSMPPPPPPPKFAIPRPPETKSEPPPHSDTSESESSELDVSPAENVDSKESLSSSSTSKDKDSSRVRKGSNDIPVPYTIPPWNGPPCHQYSLEVIKDGSVIDQLEVNEKGAYMFGRVDLCDFVLEHPTISRFHAVIQFKSSGEAYLYDLGSTHGTSINKNQVKKKAYIELHVGDVIRFGQSSRLYIFQGPSDLMPPEADLTGMRSAMILEERKDMEASLLRAKKEASMADGISWGMGEDAIEEDEDEVDEITWQTFKGQLTEKQEKTREKVIKRLEKIAHMKKEIDAIRAKDIAQGGLTQGQQTQIARNEQRISQIMEELENLEETLNESIRESLGARAGKTTRGGKRRGATEDEEEDYESDEDDFYDRTKKPPKKKGDESQSVETADSLLGKKEDILKEMENKRKLLLDEDERVQPNEASGEGDALDAYMSSVSSQLVIDNKEKLQKELTSLQSELDRVLYLLKIADPTGEAAAKRRDSKAQELIPKIAAHDTLKQHPSVKSQDSRLEHSLNKSGESKPKNPAAKPSTANGTAESSLKLQGSEIVADAVDDSTIVHTIVKPQWLGAVEDMKMQEKTEVAPVDIEEDDNFVDYKDRKEVLKDADVTDGTSGIENAAPGLIIRKRKQKQVQNVDTSNSKDSEKSEDAQLKVEDTIALLLKHSQGYHASDEVELPTENVPNNKQARNNKQQKKVLGPERPSFLSNEPECDSWVPPEGQSGDGRTSLNDRYGY